MNLKYLPPFTHTASNSPQCISQQTVAQGSCATQPEPMDVEGATVEKRESERLEIQRIVADFEQVVDWTDIDE